MRRSRLHGSKTRRRRHQRRHRHHQRCRGSRRHKSSMRSSVLRIEGRRFRRRRLRQQASISIQRCRGRRQRSKTGRRRGGGEDCGVWTLWTQSCKSFGVGTPPLTYEMRSGESLFARRAPCRPAGWPISTSVVPRAPLTGTNVQTKPGGVTLRHYTNPDGDRQPHKARGDQQPHNHPRDHNHTNPDGDQQPHKLRSADTCVFNKSGWSSVTDTSQSPDGGLPFHGSHLWSRSASAPQPVSCPSPTVLALGESLGIARSLVRRV